MNYAELLERAQASAIDFVYDRKSKSFCIRRLNIDSDMVLYTDGRYRKTSEEEIQLQANRLGLNSI